MILATSSFKTDDGKMAAATKCITLRESGRQIPCSEQHSCLLTALESHNIPVEYQCRAGYCGACRTRLISGEIHWVTQPLACLQDDEILLCCCQGKGPVEIDL